MNKITLSTDEVSSDLHQTDLRITEVFNSLQGEANDAGWPTTFIRLTGCPLRCTYCDTTYSFSGGTRIPLKSLLKQVENFGSAHVCVTGGEPLAQKNCLPLLQELCDKGYKVSLETSGALDVSQVDLRVSKVLDLKTPASGEEDKNLWQNLDYLTPHDQIKFVIANRNDYNWAKQIVEKHQLNKKVSTVWFSPVLDSQTSAFWHGLPHDLAEWILKDNLPVRFQIQLHKLIWQDAKGK